MRTAILQWWESVPLLDSSGLIAHLNAADLAAEAKGVLAPVPLPVCPAGIEPAEARARWREVYDMLMSEPRLEQDVVARQREVAIRLDPILERQLTASKFELIAVRRGSEDETPE